MARVDMSYVSTGNGDPDVEIVVSFDNGEKLDLTDVYEDTVGLMENDWLGDNARELIETARNELDRRNGRR